MRKAEAFLAWVGLIAAVLAIVAILVIPIFNSAQSTEPLFWIMVFGFSAFYGFGCFHLWPADEPSRQPQPPSPLWIASQYWLNGLGCFIGWMVARQLALSHISGESITGSEILLCLVAFLGVTGYLPFTAVGLAVAIREIARKVLEGATSTAKKE